MRTPRKVVVIGGGSTYTPALVSGLIQRHDDLPVGELWLVDIPEGRTKLDLITGYVRTMLDHHQSPIELHATFDREEALRGADYVIIQLRVGGLDARLIDETVPGEFGLLGQESIGIGGTFQALRTIPVIFELLNDVKRLCPMAWVINVANPVGLISEAVIRYGEFERFIGISTITNYMAGFFAQKLGAKESDIIPYFIGLYQMSFVKSIYYKHRNNLQTILADMDETAFRFKSDDTPAWDASFVKQLGAYPGPYLKYYYHHDEMLARYLAQQASEDTRAHRVLQIEQDLLEAYQKEPYEPITMDRGGVYYSDVACSVMASIDTDKRDYHVLVVPNNRITTDLPQDGAIEVTCRVTKHGPVPVYIGTLPLEIKGLIQHLKTYEELLVDAIIERDLDKALFAMQNHPLTTSIQQTTMCFQELMKRHKNLLTYYEEDIQ
jgi:6-phospho-beta-glucosidase